MMATHQRGTPPTHQMTIQKRPTHQWVGPTHQGHHRYSGRSGLNLQPDEGAMEGAVLGAVVMGQWRDREERENNELQAVVERRQVLPENLIAEIPWFPSP